MVWATESKTAAHRGEGPLAAGVVKLLLDGQQRMTSLYGAIRGRPPKFFDGNAQAFAGLRFHLDSETFAFHQPVKMPDDPLWIDVTELMQKGNAGLGEFVARLSASPAHAARVGDYVGRLSRLLGIEDVDLHVEEVTGADKTLDVVVDIFNRDDWVEQQGLPRGVLAYDFADPESGEQQAVLDLVWPNGVQEELSQPVAVLLNESPETLAIASRAGFRCFTVVEDFKRYVEKEILAEAVQ